jgi:GNAT superfamily N-acetyltransferase
LGSEGFRPALMIVAGRFKETEREQREIFWDDRDPEYANKEGIICGYIFKKVRPCDVSLNHLKVEKRGDTFHLIDNGIHVGTAVISYFHETKADVYIEIVQPFRRRGYATRLLGWVSDWLTANGYIHESGCAVDNHASLGLHLKLGFEIDGHIRWSEEPGA